MFNSPLWLIPIAIIITAAVLYMKYRKGKREYWQVSTDYRGLQLIKGTSVRTPAGREVFYEDGAARVDHDAIDAGIEKTFQKAECAGYNFERSQFNPKICILNSERAPESGDYCFRTPITAYDPYWGSQWDMMKGQSGHYHYVLAAGQTIAIGQPYGDVICVPSVPATLNEYLARVCEYEWEHVMLAWCDPEKYEATKTHLEGGHPLIADCPGTSPSSLFSRTAPNNAYEVVQLPPVDANVNIPTRK